MVQRFSNENNQRHLLKGEKQMGRIPVPPWKRLLERRTAEHYRCFHPETFTRRGFLGAAAGAAGLAAASQFSLVVADDKEPTAEPNPIPGGATAFGFHVHHNPLPNDPTVPLSGINDPSEIGDFNGLILDTMIRGGGMGNGVTFPGNDATGPLAFRADMGAMQGEYVGEDGNHHHGSFVFV
jgi:hypothetical protein